MTYFGHIKRHETLEKLPIGGNVENKRKIKEREGGREGGWEGEREGEREGGREKIVETRLCALVGYSCVNMTY